MGTYSRTVGVLQLIYASFFGWIALVSLGSVVQREGTFKGEYTPPINLPHLSEGTITALTSLAGLVGGCGLLGLRPWARRWEFVYVILTSLFAAEVAVHETRRGRDIGYIVLIYLVLALPYLPFLFAPPQRRKAHPVDETLVGKPVVDDPEGV